MRFFQNNVDRVVAMIYIVVPPMIGLMIGFGGLVMYYHIDKVTVRENIIHVLEM